MAKHKGNNEASDARSPVEELSAEALALLAAQQADDASAYAESAMHVTSDNPVEVQTGAIGSGEEETKTKKRTDGDKRAAFSRLASLRASNALEAMRLLGHLANTTQYLWDVQQEERMFAALESSITSLRELFASAREPAVGRKGRKSLSLRV